LTTPDWFWGALTGQRRVEVYGLFSHTDPAFPLHLLEQKDHWAGQRARYMTLETIAPLSEDPIFTLSAVAA